MKTIVIDPGHGGTDTGASNGTRLEKNDNLKMALAVRDRLVRAGQNVVMTRTGDTDVSLLNRSAISNNNNADMFVSLHRNAFSNPAANGWENFVKINAPLSYREYAETVLNEAVNVGIQTNRGLKEDNFSVLRFTAAPAQLLEMGFITNPVDNQMFDQKFDEYADAIARGILLALGEPLTPPAPPPQTGDPVIKQIQATLNQRYNTGLAVDGIAGPRTKNALVKGLQSELNKQFNAGLAVDGIFGAKTRGYIPNIRTGSRGNLTWLLQAGLYLKGYPLSVDGVFGPNTDTIVRRFQRDNGLNPDGVAGPFTFAAIFG